MKFYVATRLERVEDHQRLHAWLVCHGHELTYDWSVHGSVRGSCDASALEAVGDAELNGVLSADGVIGLLPGGRGTHWELGAAAGQRIPIFLWAPASTGILGAGEETCALYHTKTARIVHCTADTWSIFLRELWEWVASIMKPSGEVR